MLLVTSGCSMPLAVGDSSALSVASEVLLAPAPNQCPALQLPCWSTMGQATQAALALLNTKFE